MTVSRAIPLSMAAVLAAALLLALLFRGPPPDPAAALPAPTAERSSRDAGPAPLVEATSRDTIEAGQAARAPSLAEAAAAEQLDFVVVDRANAPVAGAEVGRLTTEGFLEALGSTDGAGKLRVTLRDEDGYVRVLVRHPAHAQTVRSVGHQRTGEVRVRLADLSAITGRVVDAGGTSVAGARVAALPSRHHSYVSEPSACAELLRKGAWPGALATSDTHGRFTLEGLALGEPHLVFAALGSAISQMVGTRAGTGEDAVLVLEEVLGIELRAVTGEGEPVPAASLSRSDGFWAGPAGEGVRILDRWKALGLGLTDLDLGLCWTAPSRPSWCSACGPTQEASPGFPGSNGTSSGPASTRHAGRRSWRGGARDSLRSSFPCDPWRAGPAASWSRSSPGSRPTPGGRWPCSR